MKKSFTMAAVSCLLFISGMTMAEKPAWAGKGKPDLEQVKSHAEAKKLESDIEERSDELDALIEDKKKQAKKKKGKKDKSKLNEELESLEKEKRDLEESKKALDEKLKGLEKQKQKKATQERKESGKGSETGQEQRDENSKKWWKFWE
ncbi:hypothetical protein [Vibrio profundi]|uniref:hypothetical protein n=1 Tax=Vibrio profundi TaxID=1774960 RepID=UPI00373531C3